MLFLAELSGIGYFIFCVFQGLRSYRIICSLAYTAKPKDLFALDWTNLTLWDMYAKVSRVRPKNTVKQLSSVELRIGTSK